jgi:hypothetical protein
MSTDCSFSGGSSGNPACANWWITYLCLLELGGESKGKLGGAKRSLEELEGENKEELEGENKEELGGENKGNHLSQLSTCKIQELKR